VILEHGTSSHIGTVVAMNLHRLEKKLGCCSNNFAAFFKKTYSMSSSIMWSLCKTRRCKRMEKSTPDLVADQQSLQGVVHFLLWKTLVAQMCRDPAKICNHPKKHHLAQSMFKRTLESTTSTKTCTCIPGGLNCNSDQTFKLFTQKPPEHHNGYVFLFFATRRIKHQRNLLRPMFLFLATRIKHQQNLFRPMFLVFSFFFQQQESKINRTNLHPCFCIFLLLQQESNVNRSN
jgi:hypothetical protein